MRSPRVSSRKRLIRPFGGRGVVAALRGGELTDHGDLLAVHVNAGRAGEPVVG
jgi:hypothetical protein